MARARLVGATGGTAGRMWAAVVLCGLIAPEIVAQAQPIAAPPPPSAQKIEFDVASVKLNKSNDAPNMNYPLGPGDVYVPNGGNFIASNFPLSVYIMFAYKMSASEAQALQKQVPSWVMTEKYDITAKTDNHTATKDEMRLMMRSLLADRFKLAVHRETQQVAVYALMVAKPGALGPKLVPHPASESCPNTPEEPASDAKGPQSFTVAGGFPTICGGIMGIPSDTPGMIALGARNISIGLIAGVLTGIGNLGRPVTDQTGLTGKYDFVLEFAPERRPGPGDGANTSAALDTAGPNFEQALKQQLGLKLESTKGPVDVWVVDHVEHATEN